MTNTHFYHLSLTLSLLIDFINGAFVYLVDNQSTTHLLATLHLGELSHVYVFDITYLATQGNILRVTNCFYYLEDNRFTTVNL